MNGTGKNGNKQATILVVEDSPIQAEMLRQTLVREGYSVALAKNGAEGLAFLQESRPALILSDVVMPVMGGYEFCRKIKDTDTLKDIPVILLTQLYEPEEIVHGLESGADTFMTKSASEDTLLKKIQSVLQNPLQCINRPDLKCISFEYQGNFYEVHSDRSQTLSFLISTYENAIWQNKEIVKVQRQLQNLNEKLEEIVLERTRDLSSEIVERKRVEAELRKSEQRISILHRISTIFLTCPDEELYGEVLKVVLDAMASRFGIFGFIADNGDMVVPSMTRGAFEEDQVPAKTIVFPPHTWGNTLWGRAISEKTSFFANETFHTPSGHIPIENFLTVPIIFGGKVLGLLSVANKEGGVLQ